MLHLRSLLKLSGLSDRRHQPLIIGSAGTPALRRHAVTDKARRGRRVMRRRLRPEDFTGRAPCAGLGRRSAKWPSVAAEAEPWAHDGHSGSAWPRASEKGRKFGYVTRCSRVGIHPCSFVLNARAWDHQPRAHFSNLLAQFSSSVYSVHALSTSWSADPKALSTECSKNLKHLTALCTECSAPPTPLNTQCCAGSGHPVLSACTVCGVALYGHRAHPTASRARVRCVKKGRLFPAELLSPVPHG